MKQKHTKHTVATCKVTGWYRYLLTNDSVSCFIRFQLLHSTFVQLASQICSSCVSFCQAMPFHSSAVLPPKHGIGGSRMSLAWYLCSKERRCRSGEVVHVLVTRSRLLPFWNAPVTRQKQIVEYLRINGIPAKGGDFVQNCLV